MNKISKVIKENKWRLHVINTDKFKMSRFSVNFILPKDMIRSPMTKLMLSVMMRGSENYPTITHINRKLDELYDTTVSLRNMSFGDKCIFQISCKVLDNKYRLAGDECDILAEVLAVLSDILYHPLKDGDGLLLSQYVESERKIMIDAINSRINDQRAYAARQCNKLMFEGTPYAISVGGELDTVSSFTPKQLTENIERFFDDARVECYYVGNESADHIHSLLVEHFDFPNSTEKIFTYGEKPFESNRSDIQMKNEDMDVSQGRLEIGYRCGTVLSDKEYAAMALFNEIWGGSSVSKLFMNVRERKSLCYYCYSSYHSATGTINVGCGIKPENYGVAMDEISRQLDEMKMGRFTDEEMLTSKRTVISGYKQITDSAAGMEGFYLRRTVADVEYSPKDCISFIEDVKREDIVEAANRVCMDTVYFINGIADEEELDNE
jgi:predicted Zn-dependent peptidase